LKDFLNRRTPKFVRNNAILNLIKAGCFNFTNKTKQELMEELFEMYPAISEPLDQPDYVYEKQALGLYLSQTPYDKFATTNFADYPDNSYLTTIAEITEITEIVDKNQNTMAFLNATNKHGNFRIVVFTKLWNDTNSRSLLQLNDIVILKGRKDRDSLLLNEVKAID
jgi:DNA polymerase III subunit alpha